MGSLMERQWGGSALKGLFQACFPTMYKEKISNLISVSC